MRDQDTPPPPLPDPVISFDKWTQVFNLRLIALPFDQGFKGEVTAKRFLQTCPLLNPWPNDNGSGTCIQTCVAERTRNNTQVFLLLLLKKPFHFISTLEAFNIASFKVAFTKL